MHKVDKSGWAQGEWMEEVDHKEWVDDATGYGCEMWRHDRAGHWCGYVQIPPEHALYGKGYNHYSLLVERMQERGAAVEEILEAMRDMVVPDEPQIESFLKVHGTITYAGDRPGGDEVRKGWFFGFDCAADEDYMPGLQKSFAESGAPRKVENYRNVAFVEAECRKLARQLKDLS